MAGKIASWVTPGTVRDAAGFGAGVVRAGVDVVRAGVDVVRAGVEGARVVLVPPAGCGAPFEMLRRIYNNTLLDENAAAHFAFGAGFGNTREDGQRRGVNRASLHLDVMIGSDDFEATAMLPRGRQQPLIAGGLWQDL